MRGFTLLGKEFTEIIKNKKILIPIIGILFIPILYAGMFLWAFWDPYERLNDLPVAIVNEDKGAVLEGEEIKGGEDLVANLKDNKSFKWEFVDEKTALKGMDERKYYMLIRIPEDFSSNATTLLTDHPTPSSLKFIPNESLNFLSSQIGSTAVEHIKSEVSSELTKTYAEKMFASVEEVSQGFTDASEGANKLHDGTVKLEDGSRKVTDGLNTMLTESDKLKKGTSDLATGMNKLADGQGQLAAGAKEVQGGIHQLNTEVKASLSGLKELEPKIAGLKTKSEEVGKLDQVAQSNAQLATATVNQLTALQTAVEGLPEEYKTQLQPSIDGLMKSLTASQKQSAGIAAGTNTLKEQMSGLQVNLPDTQKLNTLVEGIQKLENGQDKFVEGFSTFGANFNEAKAGANELAQKTAPLIAGVNELANGSTQITNGLGEVNSGTTELATKLGEGAEKTGEVKGTDETYNMFANPVKVKTEKIQEVPNYGTGFTPYFLSLGLFVGALLLSIVYPLRDTVGVPKSGFSWFISKFGVLLAVGIIQALVADVILLFGLGIEVQSVPYFILFSILTSLAFIALIQCLVTAFGDAGRFIAIITLILQLTTSAGTFPLELIPEFLQHFNAWLPMTYSVSGFKAIVSSGDFNFMWQNAGILVVFIVLLSVGTIASLTWMHKRQFGKFTEEA
ncbi:membrane protein [Bacillus manliponensis]|uniref:Membrane protein n=1 Tax=Bacillus manliponensis TaxID=574376 RepID=A0A073JYM2_9BACI|nr:YhgE/Pip domain-containing protein [Bacillus manliponensis]KEK20139.1 membrane protein [Bacillus manliponensis]